MSKDDITELLTIYRSHPCQTLPNAFWKTARVMENADLFKKYDFSGELESLAIRDNSRILSYRCAESGEEIYQHINFQEIQLALIHDCYKVIEKINFSHKTAFFRLIHNGKPPKCVCPEGFHYQFVNPDEDLPGVASFINRCYENISLNEKIVESWLDHPVYDPNLWVWIKETCTGRFAALGIAEIDHRVPEASLEWVQVHPDFQKRGLGKAVIGELLRRVSPRVDFTTVSGEVNNPSSPEILYRRTGFEGSDVWWLLKK